MKHSASILENEIDHRYDLDGTIPMENSWRHLMLLVFEWTSTHLLLSRCVSEWCVKREY